MAYPRRLLSQDEDVELELHPHWKALVLPVLALLVVVPVASFGAARVPDGSAQSIVRAAIAAVALVVLVATTLLPFLRWVTTHYVVTNRRLITRRGIIARTGRDMPLTRINDISFSHTVVERVLGCGTLVVESAGERGQLTLDDVPGVEDVQRRLYELADAAGEGWDDRWDDEAHHSPHA
ncbi:MAG: PH domain-containing protein [Angustibacter sp.]